MRPGAVSVIGCRGASPGKASGPAVVSSDAICFYLVDPPTGKVIESGHAIEGRSIAGAVLVCPGGKGSSVVQADGLYQLSKAGTAPAADRGRGIRHRPGGQRRGHRCAARALRPRGLRADPRR